MKGIESLVPVDTKFKELAPGHLCTVQDRTLTMQELATKGCQFWFAFAEYLFKRFARWIRELQTSSVCYFNYRLSQSTTTARKMPQFSNGREGSTRIGNLRKATSNSPAPEWRHEQAPILLSESTPNSIQQPLRVCNAHNPTKRKSPPETSNLPPTTEGQPFDERGIVKRRRSIPLTAPASGLPQVKLLLATPPSTPTSPRPKTPPRQDRSRLHPKWRRRRRSEPLFDVFGASLEGEARVRRERQYRRFDACGGRYLRWELQPRQDAGEHSATTRREGSMLEPKQGAKDRTGHKSQMHSQAASDSVRNTSTKTSSTVEDDAGDLLACKLSRMAPFTFPSMMLPADAEFSITDVEKAVDVLTTISNLCDAISGQPRAETRAKLYGQLAKLPDLLTRQGRDKQPKMAARFREFVYRHPDSGRWGPIESFDKLGDDIMGLTLFRARSRASPKQRHPGVFEV